MKERENIREIVIVDVQIERFHTGVLNLRIIHTFGFLILCYLRKNNIIRRVGSLDLRTSGEECDNIGRICASYGIIRNKLRIPCFVKKENGNAIDHSLLFHKCVKIERIVYIDFITFNRTSNCREIRNLLHREGFDGLTRTAPVCGEFQDGVLSLLRIEFKETLKCFAGEFGGRERHCFLRRDIIH